MYTDSFTAKVFPKPKLVLSQNDAITTAEEMSIRTQEPELAEQLDEIAKANGVSVLGTGINPGLIMDLVAIMTVAARC